MSSSSKSGKCSNFGNCSLADARTTVQVPTGMDFVCTECGKPLLMSDMGDSGGGGNKMALIGAAVAAVVLIAGGAWFFLGRSKPAPPPSSPPVAAPAPAPVAAPEPVAAPAHAAPPITGHCSDADAKAGLCRKAQ